MGKKEFIDEIIPSIKENNYSKQEISKIKIKLSKKHKLSRIPTDFEILLEANIEDRDFLKQLTTKPVRTGSGVAVVAIMTKPSKCPHGKCTYCPGGVNSVFGDVPQSYTGREPATMRGIRNKYDPYFQIFNRLEQYTVLGHNCDKVELIIMGGTFPACTNKYQEGFIGYSFKALNDFSDMFFQKDKFRLKKFKQFFELPGEIGSKERVKSIHSKLKMQKNHVNLLYEQQKNEKSRIRCVALCVETRPDHCRKKHINNMLKLGTTRVELGVQSLQDNVLKKIERGHDVNDSIIATQLMKDSLLKVGYHMMPGLPLTSLKQDLDMLKELFSNPSFRPDALKIYPCMVMEGTKLYNDYKKGQFKPMNTPEAAKLIAKFKEYVPKYCRIMRVQRDIPTKVTSAGVDMTNLRQEVHKLTKICKCIRCREPRNRHIDWDNVNILDKEYEASGGKEFFISAEDTKNNILVGFCRLRIPNKPFRKEITNKSAGIRELHVYGTATALGKKGKTQHRGLGKMLLKKAEHIADEHKKNKIVVISGIGVREYYRKLGYRKQRVYMVKKTK